MLTVILWNTRRINQGYEKSLKKKHEESGKLWFCIFLADWLSWRHVRTCSEACLRCRALAEAGSLDCMFGSTNSKPVTRGAEFNTLTSGRKKAAIGWEPVYNIFVLHFSKANRWEPGPMLSSARYEYLVLSL